MKTIAELKRISFRIARVMWNVWTGMDILLLILLSLFMIIYEPIIRITAISLIIMAVCYQIGKLYNKTF